MSNKFCRVLFIITLSSSVWNPCKSKIDGLLKKNTSSIQVLAYVRNYITGPIDGKLSLTKYDAITLYAGSMRDQDPGSAKKFVRKWLLWGDADHPDTLCHLQRVYDYGKEVTFICPLSGTYIAYAEDGEVDDINLTDQSHSIGDANDVTITFRTRNSFKKFDLSTRWGDDNKPLLDPGSDFYSVFKNETAKSIFANGANFVQSDPIDIIETDYCYYYNYYLVVKAKVGYIFRESEPLTGIPTSGSYILMELLVWIMEPNSITDSEKDSGQNQKLEVSQYSKVLTRRFHSKGLSPCLRKTHPAVELSEDIVFVEERDSELKTPHWKFELKVHTDTLISTISDIGFTISSRQHVALFHCFVGDVRVLVSVRDFDFIDESQADRNQINWKISRMEKIQEEYLKLSIKHIYGHGIVYFGPKSGREYQPGEKRTDFIVVNNPCMAQEFAIALSGRLYIVEEFLKDYRRNVIDVLLPGLVHIDAKDSTVSEADQELRHKMYLQVTDVAFTPTHVAVLMQDSKIYLHSHSIYYKGLAYLTNTVKFRIEALVKRRWCAGTGTLKTHNMIVPGFSKTGAIIIIQIYPTENNVNMWIVDPPASCMVKEEKIFHQTFEKVTKMVNETCIHKDELVQHSNERGLPVPIDVSGCETEDNQIELKTVELSQSDVDELPTFLINEGVQFPQNDPHFPEDLRNVAIHKIAKNSTFYNLALIYKMDEDGQSGRKLIAVLEKNGLEPLKGSDVSSLTLHSVEFTAVEKTFLACVQFRAAEFEKSAEKYDFTMMITTINAVDMANKIFPTQNKKEETLKTVIPFPGVLLVRSKPYMLKNLLPPDSNNPKYRDAIPYTTKIYSVNTALPAYVIDLGNVFVFSSVESKYARPLTYFPREKIHEILRKIKSGDTSSTNQLLKEDRFVMFEPDNYKCASETSCPHPSEQLQDIVVTEQGMVSILKRRLSSDDEDGQSVFIGSIMTLDSLREIRPFAAEDNIFQLATPDGEIVYGKYGVRPFVYFRECTTEENTNTKLDTPDSCLIPHTKNNPPFCVKETDKAVPDCIPWTFVADATQGNPAIPYANLGYCESSVRDSCILKGEDGGRLPDNFPTHELDFANILSVPFYSLLNGNLQMAPEEKLTDTVIGSLGISNRNFEDRICPFANFDVTYLKIDYAEIGFKTRITATISYLGKNVPSEAELIVELENVPGIQVQISGRISEEADETTLSKTIDITMTLTDIDLARMQREKLERTDFRDETNRAREIASIFSITVRPSIINLRCKKTDFYTTIQYNIGCDPFNEIKLLADASPLVAREVVDENEVNVKDTDWQRKGDFLEISRDHVWHKQRKIFKCEEDSKEKCKVPYAYLFGNQVYDISWRDKFVPQFEQFLTARARRVTGNVIVYDMLGQESVMNLTQLDAGCYNNGSLPSDNHEGKQKTWYFRLLDSTKSIAKHAKEREDVYRYYSDCFDSKFLPREKPKALSNQHYRLINLTNKNRIRFDATGDIRTKNRNQIFIFRAAVINTYYNRFTYCKLMDTFFLVRVTGIPTPRQGLDPMDCFIIVLTLFLFFLIIYFIFYKFYTWKLDIPAIPGSDQEEPENEAGPWKPQFGPVESDHMMKRLAVKVHAVAKWRQKALERVVKKYQADPEDQPEWAKERLKARAMRAAAAAEAEERNK